MGDRGGQRTQTSDPANRWIQGAVLVAVVVAALAAWSRPAAAAEPSACALASTLAELAPGERKALEQACEGGAAPAEPALHAAILRMTSLPGQRTAALARLLAPLRGQRSLLIRRGDGLAPDLTRAQASLVARPEALAGPNCADLRRAVETFVNDTQGGEAAASPFLHDDPALARCLGNDGAALQPVRLVALRADSVDELFIAAAAPDFAHLAWLQPRDALVFGRHRFFVAAVPPGAAVAAVARLTNTEIPATWREIVSDDVVAWSEPPALTCINLDVRLGPDAAVFVDGAPMPRDESGVSRVLTVSRQEHDIVALECPEKGAPCHVRYREELPAAALQRRTSQCLGVRLDIAARPRPTVAILNVTSGDSCREAPLRADGTRQAASDYLTFETSHRRTHDFRDLEAYAAATDALFELRTRLQPGAGATTGAKAGPDGTDLLGTAAKEAWRQGIDLLLSFDLQCNRRGDAWTYRVSATRVALGSMFRRGLYSGAALDLGSFIESVTEEFRAVERYSVALANVIDRSLEAPYVRLLPERPSAPYRQGVPLVVQRYAGRPSDAPCKEDEPAACTRHERPLVVRAHRLGLGGARPLICNQLDQSPTHHRDQLAAARKAIQAQKGAPLVVSTQRDPASSGDLRARSERAHLRPGVPGWYLVAAHWGDDGDLADATCVELAAPPREIWADITMSFSALQYAPLLAPDQFYARARFGYTHYLRPILGLGIFVGYAHTSYALPDPRPAWQDLGVEGTTPLEWRRNAMLLGGIIELRAPFTRLPFDLRLRVAPTLSLGALDLSRIPPTMKSFLSPDNAPRSNLDVDLDLHFDAIVSYSVGKVALQHILLAGIHELGSPMVNPITPYENSGFFLGFGFGVGVLP